VSSSATTVSLRRWLRRQLREPTIVARMSFNDAQRRHIDGLLDRWERER
jgi:hypothetical protein